MLFDVTEDEKLHGMAYQRDLFPPEETNQDVQVEYYYDGIEHLHQSHGTRSTPETLF